MGFWNGLDGYRMSWRDERGHPESDAGSCKGHSIDEFMAAPTFSSL